MDILNYLEEQNKYYCKKLENCNNAENYAMIITILQLNEWLINIYNGKEVVPNGKANSPYRKFIICKRTKT